MGGNNFLLILFLLFGSFVFGAEVLFYATDMSQRLKKEFTINKQFLVHVVVKKIAGQIDVQVPDLIAYGGRRTTVQVSTVNGVSTIKHSYAITFGQEGVISLGKARVVAGNNEFFSPSLEVVVSDRGIEEDSKALHQNSQDSSEKEKYLEPFSRLVTEINEPFVGQKISCFLYIYYDDAMDRSPSFRFSLPFSDEYRVSELGKPEGGREFFNGKSYRYVRWPFDLVPLKSGEISIEPFSIEYEYEDQRSNFQSIWDHFAHFFDKKRYLLRVPKQSLFVREIPLFQGNKVHAVGQFKSFTASVNPLIITEKEASTVTLELIGNGNFDDIVHPTFIMPEEVLLYESHNFITPLSGFKKKSFEYIIQPHHPGNLEIPSQTIITFDPIAQKHFILKSDPQTIVVKTLPNQEKLSIKTSLRDDEEKSDGVSVEQELFGKQNDFIEQFKIPGKDFWDLSGILNPVYFFYVLIIGLLMVIYCFFLKFPGYFLQGRKFFNRVIAYRQASNDLLQKRLKGDGAGIYTIFINLFLDRLQPSEIDFEYRFLEERGAAFFNDIEKKQWIEFCCSVAALHFGGSISSDSLDDIFNEAKFWIDELQKKGL
jgi:hypothetical protein